MFEILHALPAQVDGLSDDTKAYGVLVGCLIAAVGALWRSLISAWERSESRLIDLVTRSIETQGAVVRALEAISRDNAADRAQLAQNTEALEELKGKVNEQKQQSKDPA